MLVALLGVFAFPNGSRSCVSKRKLDRTKTRARVHRLRVIHATNIDGNFWKLVFFLGPVLALMGNAADGWLLGVLHGYRSRITNRHLIAGDITIL